MRKPLKLIQMNLDAIFFFGHGDLLKNFEQKYNEFKFLGWKHNSACRI